MRRRHDIDAPQNIADGTDARKPGIAGEIIAARQACMRRPQQPRFEPHIGAGFEGRCAADREANAVRHLRRSEAGDLVGPQHETRADPAKIHLFDIAFYLRDFQMGEDGCRDPRRAPARRHEAET